MSISTHVLDSVLGSPAVGLGVRLLGPRGELITEGTTDDDGRCRLAGDTAPGAHRIVFDTGPWFAGQGRETFYPSVTLDFAVTDAAAHHHVPLLLSPFAYSTYRGS